MNKHEPLPRLAEQKWPSLRYVRKVTATEWASECPKCGSAGHDSRHGAPDRFHVFEDNGGLRGWCRRCNYFEFANSGERVQLSPEKQAQLELERSLREAEHLARRAARLKEFASARFWEVYHLEMSAQARAYWHGLGIDDSLIEFWRLGYVEDRRFKNGDFYFSASAHTMPIFDAGQASMDSALWEPVNCQYRLVSAPDGVGRYRQEHGIAPRPFVARPDWQLSGDGRVAVFEGTKKAGAVYAHAADSGRIQCLGLPGSTNFCDLPERLRNLDRVYVFEDPDAAGAKMAHDFARQVGKAARIVKTPIKVDDMILLARGRGENTDTLLRGYMKAARAVV